MSSSFTRSFLSIIAAIGITAMIWIPTLTVTPASGVTVVSFV